MFGDPSIVGRNGIEEVVPLPLSEKEEEQLKSSAAKLKQHLETIGF
ncbi:hypothetical protein PP175_06210 [Aneurinibacillus sp. Ricciae_BoGa-3]|nr:hypothetical protein [Aneurinibacillus sp. Ricciae_BoGa-3]WCK55540.1 hypothetical protein PP175_06210 [Aneurinibacillus sp. Ricciae_BoGa-3]